MIQLSLFGVAASFVGQRVRLQGSAAVGTAVRAVGDFTVVVRLDTGTEVQSDVALLIRC